MKLNTEEDEQVPLRDECSSKTVQSAAYPCKHLPEIIALYFYITVSILRIISGNFFKTTYKLNVKL